MRLYLVISSWVHRTETRPHENLTSIIDAKDAAGAIAKHVEEGVRRWPDYLHDAKGLAYQDITDRAKRFVESWG